jgi:hypothetical protein
VTGGVDRNVLTNKYEVDVNFTGTVNRKKGYSYAHGKAKCRVGDKVFVDTGISLDKFAKLDQGESQKFSVTYFAGSDGLDKSPDRCDLSVTVGDVRDGFEEIGHFCWTPGSLSEGACSK